MARQTGRSRTALSDAAGGDKLPTWDTVVAYVSFCKEDPNAYRVAWENLLEQRKARSDDVMESDPASKPDAPALLSNLPRHPARLFLGRDSALNDMNDLLSAAATGLVIGPVLHGLGGIGKPNPGI